MSIISNNKESRVMIFIDLRNIEVAIKTTKVSLFKMDYYRLAKYLSGQRNIVAAYIFDGTLSETEKESSETIVNKFHDLLRYNGFRVIAKKSVENRVQKEVDVAMACEMVVHALRDNYDVAIVVSGDRDFVPAIQHVQSAGKAVEVAAFNNSSSSEMKRAADKFVELDQIPLLMMNNLTEELKKAEAE